jgi:hypothetical protein
MGRTKYGKYIIKEPLEKCKWGDVPSIHACGHEECFTNLPEFPVDLQLRYIKKPFIMVEKPHKHDVDELIFILGGNPSNFYEFDAEVELYMGEEQEKHTIDTTSIVYVPKGLLHCPLVFKRVGKPLLAGHMLLTATYRKSDMEGKPDTTGYQTHKERKRYTPEEILKLRGH